MYTTVTLSCNFYNIVNIYAVLVNEWEYERSTSVLTNEVDTGAITDMQED